LNLEENAITILLFGFGGGRRRSRSLAGSNLQLACHCRTHLELGELFENKEIINKLN